MGFAVAVYLPPADPHVEALQDTAFSFVIEPLLSPMYTLSSQFFSSCKNVEERVDSQPVNQDLFCAFDPGSGYDPVVYNSCIM